MKNKDFEYWISINAHLMPIPSIPSRTIWVVAHCMCVHTCTMCGVAILAYLINHTH